MDTYWNWHSKAILLSIQKIYILKYDEKILKKDIVSGGCQFMSMNVHMYWFTA